ncbi:MAG: gliding motility protein GldL [Flavobacteriales bacterium]|nr:gliding motility protein GldL [Flavobacteriales bacterium]
MGFIDFETVQGKQRMNYIYSIGAAVVIIGALFKIIHLPYGDWIIGAGLLTEALIFVVSAFEPQHADVDWARVYPELAEGADPSTFAKGKKPIAAVKESGDIEKAFSDKLDKIFADARFNSERVAKLGEGIDKFATATSSLVNVVDANKNAQSYSDQLAIAANHMGTLNNYYASHAAQTESQAEIGKSFMKAAESSVQYGQELTSAASNVASMNKMYSNQIDSMTKQVELSASMVDGIEVSVVDAKAMHAQVKQLTENLTSLNSVYGGMLTAMNVNK